MTTLSEDRPVAKLRVHSFKGFPERVFPLYGGNNVVGRDPNTCSVCLDMPFVEDRHLCIDLPLSPERPLAMVQDVVERPGAGPLSTIFELIMTRGEWYELNTDRVCVLSSIDEKKLVVMDIDICLSVFDRVTHQIVSILHLKKLSICGVVNCYIEGLTPEERASGTPTKSQHREWILRTCRGRQYRVPAITLEEYMATQAQPRNGDPGALSHAVPNLENERNVDADDEAMVTLPMVDSTIPISYDLEDSVPRTFSNSDNAPGSYDGRERTDREQSSSPPNTPAETLPYDGSPDGDDQATQQWRFGDRTGDASKSENTSLADAPTQILDTSSDLQLSYSPFAHTAADEAKDSTEAAESAETRIESTQLVEPVDHIADDAPTQVQDISTSLPEIIRSTQSTQGTSNTPSLTRTSRPGSVEPQSQVLSQVYPTQPNEPLHSSVMRIPSTPIDALDSSHVTDRVPGTDSLEEDPVSIIPHTPEDSEEHCPVNPPENEVEMSTLEVAGELSGSSLSSASSSVSSPRDVPESDAPLLHKSESTLTREASRQLEEEANEPSSQSTASPPLTNHLNNTPPDSPEGSRRRNPRSREGSLKHGLEEDSNLDDVYKSKNVKRESIDEGNVILRRGTPSRTLSRRSTADLDHRPTVNISSGETAHSKQYKGIVKSLNWTYDEKQYNVLVFSANLRTAKFMTAIVRGIPIVSTTWLDECHKQGGLVPWDEFMYDAQDMEETYGFNFKETCMIAKDKRAHGIFLFEGLRFFFLVRPGNASKKLAEQGFLTAAMVKDSLSCIVKECGGTIIDQKVGPKQGDEETTVIVGPDLTPVTKSHLTWTKAQEFLAKGFRVVTKEFILSSILHQKLDYSSAQHSSHSKRSNPSAGIAQQPRASALPRSVLRKQKSYTQTPTHLNKENIATSVASITRSMAGIKMTANLTKNPLSSRQSGLALGDLTNLKGPSRAQTRPLKPVITLTAPNVVEPRSAQARQHIQSTTVHQAVSASSSRLTSAASVIPTTGTIRKLSSSSLSTNSIAGLRTNSYHQRTIVSAQAQREVGEIKKAIGRRDHGVVPTVTKATNIVSSAAKVSATGKQCSSRVGASVHGPETMASSLKRSSRAVSAAISTPRFSVDTSKAIAASSMAPSRKPAEKSLQRGPLILPELVPDDVQTLTEDKNGSSQDTEMSRATPMASPELDEANQDQSPFHDKLQSSYDNEPSMLSEYQADIIQYLHAKELELMPDPDYINHQPEICWEYRAQLIHWLVTVHERFDLLQETLHLCINLLDRFLSATMIPISQLQLAGIVALSLASKFEETRAPSLAYLAEMAAGAYSLKQIKAAEIGMLKVLKYELGAPGPMTFLRRISRVDEFDIDVRTLAKYLVDVTLCEARFVGVPASMAAAIGYCAALRLLYRGMWSDEHAAAAGYERSALIPGINLVFTLLEDPEATHPSLFTKYQSEQYLHASDYVQNLGQAQLRSLHL
ncbi:hypothetical protein BGZ94_004911 [Podila epigama]|nr:hypothetical protein BGZ94_004911 [Podila epigama]